MTQVPNPKSEIQARELTCDELDHVAGGETARGGVLIALGDGSVRNTDAVSDYAVFRNRFGTGI